MAQIIDFFTRKQVSAVDKMVEDKGVYAGAIPLKDAERLRKRIEELNRERDELEQRIFDWEMRYANYTMELDDILKKLRVTSTTEDVAVFIDEDGHVWYVPKPKIDLF